MRSHEVRRVPGDEPRLGERLVGVRAVSARRSGRSSEHLAVDAWESLFRAQSTLLRRFQASPVWQGRQMREYDVLYQLVSADDTGVRQRDLMSRVMMSQPSLSRVVDRLVAEGFVHRCPDPRDGRGALLSLTEQGRALQRRIGGGHARDIARALRSRLSDDELAQLQELTERLVGPETRYPDE